MEEAKEVKVEESKTSSKGQKYHKKGDILPVVASECPGWVCYAEKRVGELVLPNMSKTKSPQQLCGVLSKLFMLTHQKV